MTPTTVPHKPRVETATHIIIKGARVHNLKNVDLTLPRKKLIVFTGVSGSGKSSLAFDTLYAEGHRRYVESLSAYARQFLERMNKPDVDYIQGISPAIAIEQKTISKNPRSTVGTVTEIYDYLRLLFARIGQTYTPDTNELVLKHTPEDVIYALKLLDVGTKLIFSFQMPEHEKRTMREELATLKQKGFFRLVVGGDIVDINDDAALEKIVSRKKRDFRVLADRLVLKTDDETLQRISEAVATAFGEGDGRLVVSVVGGKEYLFSDKFEADGQSYEEPSPQMFAFNSPAGACPVCQGFGRVSGVDEDLVIPNRSLSLRDGAIAAFSGEKHSKHFRDLLRVAAKYEIPLDVPYEKLTRKQKDFVWKGTEKKAKDVYLGVDGFFKLIEKEAQYKMHYRILLSRYRGYSVCPECSGSRLRKDALYVKIAKHNIHDLVQMTLGELKVFFDTINLSRFDLAVAARILEEIQKRLRYLNEVGLDYLTLDRLSQTLSGGESQRINLATSLGSSLVGSLYILDEPSIGLHQRDSERLIRILKRLRDIGNTVIVVEHDREIMEAADMVVDLGPQAGIHGGEIIFQGSPAEMMLSEKSLTAKYLKEKNKIPLPKKRRTVDLSKAVTVVGAMENNLKNIDVAFPLGVMTCVTGVSGSGKSTLVNDVLHLGILKEKVGTGEKVGTHKKISGMAALSKVEMIDQSPIGRTSRSNPATYLKIFDDIRALFAATQIAKMKGYDAGNFSFNIPGGRCETCQGEGMITIEMQFLADIETICEACNGKRYKPELLEVVYKNKNISDVLELSVSEALEFFKDSKNISKKLKVLDDVGLGYVKLGQSGSTLSGGESQRLKLAYHIASTESERTLFIFDEPTTGLHFDDIRKLLKCFDRLLENNNTLVIIEHNLEVIKCADWIIDLGPEAGDKGGEIVAIGTPEDVSKVEASYTAKYLREYME